MKITKLTVKGMHCHACEEIINDTLMEQNGVLSATADSKNNLVVVSYDEPKITLDKIKQAIKKEGYEVL